MPRTNAQIDALNLMREEGEPIIPYETEGATELTDEQKAENEKIRLDAEAKKVEGQKTGEDNQQEIEAKKKEEEEQLKIAAQKEQDEKPKVTEPELDDAQILAYLKSKKGKDIASLDELLNPKVELSEEEKQKIAEQREANKLAYGLSKGIFTNKQFEEYITDSKNPKELVFAAYTAEQKANDPEITDEDIEAEFNERFGLEEEKESRRYKSGQALIANIAQSLISKKHAKIIGLEKDFSVYEKSQEDEKQMTSKMKSQAPLYKKDVESIRQDIKKVSLPISDNEKFDVEIDDNILDEVMADMLSDDYANRQIKNGWQKESIQEIAQTAAIIKSLPILLKKYADVKVLAKQAGLRGILPEDKNAGKEKRSEELTENQKKAISMMDGMGIGAN